MSIETIVFCPLGQTCEDVRDGKIYRCRFYSSMARYDDEGQEVPGSRYDECDIHLVSVHLTELKKGTRGVQASVEDLRNVVEKTRPVVVFPKERGNGQDKLGRDVHSSQGRLVREGDDIQGDRPPDGGDI